MENMLIYIIALMEGNKCIKQYEFPFVPNVNDEIALTENTKFKVEGRILPTSGYPFSRNPIMFNVGLSGKVIQMTEEEVPKIEQPKTPTTLNPSY